MDFSIGWSESAIFDLEQIVRYVAEDDPIAATNLGEGIIEAVTQIGSFPRSGRAVPEEEDDALREILYSPYRIVYEIDDSVKSISIVRVWHAARGEIELR